jgi:hypothetical protein
MIAIANSLTTSACKLWVQFRHGFLHVVTALAEARTRQAQIEIDRYLRIRRDSKDKEHGTID